ncbi:uncharacterized protein Z518_02993 [Rhinocladiella mackenziei CBS 650.93]|uniref:RING-type E3 ubiquitin transferase n=1 Tax=Rhinocladiella mackenziei CBS 650.93 TaxID=1442369 RepID=A0A0D2G1B1_9EURO|nr:uncharacterized protein Z518_02993 [Rhinocladiella mackenziei CBS 650.93]KIX08337.1 hypothetical protein Z518_02993 [Rhinocladiella mackenziei CBS 650.93]
MASTEPPPDDDGKNSTNGGNLSPAVFFLIVVGAIIFGLNLLRILVKRKIRARDASHRLQGRQPGQDDVEEQNTTDRSRGARKPPKIRRIRIQELDEIAPRMSYGDWKATARLKGSEKTGSRREQCEGGQGDTPVDYPGRQVSLELPPLRSSVDITEGPGQKGLKELARVISNGKDDGESDGKGFHDDEDQCVICTDSFHPKNQVRVLQCGHLFHAKCVEKWLTSVRANCPVCKSEVEDMPTCGQ